MLKFEGVRMLGVGLYLLTFQGLGVYGLEGLCFVTSL